jgi:exopolyphosphatase/guanosine-5'-triphosphate,3'-diphosphate pyrophosphatase
MLGDDPPRADALAALRRMVADTVRERFPTQPSPTAYGIAVAGTATTIATLALGLDAYDPERTHGAHVTDAQDDGELETHDALPVAQRREVAGLEPDRAPVIVAGVAILLGVLDAFGAAGVTISERDILDGIALRAGAIALDEGIDELPQPHGRTAC